MSQFVTTSTCNLFVCRQFLIFTYGSSFRCLWPWNTTTHVVEETGAYVKVIIVEDEKKKLKGRLHPLTLGIKSLNFFSYYRTQHSWEIIILWILWTINREFKNKKASFFGKVGIFQLVSYQKPFVHIIIITR